jgi:hypothetical protein
MVRRADTNGAAPYIDYNCNGTFTDNDDIWGFEQPAARYLNGTGQMSGTFTQPSMAASDSVVYDGHISE